MLIGKFLMNKNNTYRINITYNDPFKMKDSIISQKYSGIIEKRKYTFIITNII